MGGEAPPPALVHEKNRKTQLFQWIFQFLSTGQTSIRLIFGKMYSEASALWTLDII